jgi:pimeloyl-ACP methyl ester carboxylesterase
MHRRDFIAVAAGAVAGGALGCAVRGAGAPVAAAGSPPIDAAAFHAARRFASTASGRIAYVERGAGPTALFLHGLPLNGFQWRGALERLWPHRRCIAPDSMGLGYSEVPEGQSLAPEAQASMLVALLDTLAIPAVDLVASDSGGAIAQLFVARHPERVRTLLLTNCDVHEDSPPPALLPVIAAARAGTFADEVLAPQLTDKANARLATGLGGCCYTDPAHLTDEAVECYLTPLLSSPLRKAQFHGYTVALERNPLLAIEPALKRCQAPLRVVWGTGDTIFDPSGPDWLDRTFPRSRGVRRIEGANLFFPEEVPDVIAEEARKLWLGRRP